jgi:hypothetical protein
MDRYSKTDTMKLAKYSIGTGGQFAHFLGRML